MYIYVLCMHTYVRMHVFKYCIRSYGLPIALSSLVRISTVSSNDDGLLRDNGSRKNPSFSFIELEMGDTLTVISLGIKYKESYNKLTYVIIMYAMYAMYVRTYHKQMYYIHNIVDANKHSKLLILK